MRYPTFIHLSTYVVQQNSFHPPVHSVGFQCFSNRISAVNVFLDEGFWALLNDNVYVQDLI